MLTTTTVWEAFSSQLIVNYMTEETIIFNFPWCTKIVNGNPDTYSCYLMFIIILRDIYTVNRSNYLLSTYFSSVFVPSYLWITYRKPFSIKIRN